MKKKFYWIRIDEDDNNTLPEVGKEVLIVSEEGRMSVERRRNGNDFIYSDSTDTGVALFWMDLPDYPNHKF